MKISEVAERTGIVPRLLRYYEEQAPLEPARNSSGIRDHSEEDVETAQRIRQLLDAGLTTESIRTVLPCLTTRVGSLAPICDETVQELMQQQARIQETIDSLTKSRDAIARVISAS